MSDQAKEYMDLKDFLKTKISFAKQKAKLSKGSNRKEHVPIYVSGKKGRFTFSAKSRGMTKGEKGGHSISVSVDDYPLLAELCQKIDEAVLENADIIKSLTMGNPDMVSEKYKRLAESSFWNGTVRGMEDKDLTEEKDYFTKAYEVKLVSESQDKNASNDKKVLKLIKTRIPLPDIMKREGLYTFYVTLDSIYVNKDLRIKMVLDDVYVAEKPEEDPTFIPDSVRANFLSLLSESKRAELEQQNSSNVDDSSNNSDDSGNNSDDSSNPTNRKRKRQDDSDEDSNAKRAKTEEPTPEQNQPEEFPC